MAGVEQVKGGILMVIGFMLVVLIGANILPTALGDWFNASTSNWGTATSAIWSIAPLFAVLGVLLYFVAQAFDIF